MADTKQLIETLSAQATPVRPLRPQRYALILLAALSIYAICAQCWLEGFRPDLAQQLQRPLFVVELLLLAAMLISSVLAALHAMRPDAIVQKYRMRLPFIFSGLMLLLVAFQLFMPHDVRMVMSNADSHTHGCTAYIAFSSMLPAILIFWLIRKGATIMPMRAGLLAVIASMSVGALTLRLAEANDEIAHLLMWHYAPSLFFAALGAVLGRYLLRW
ncbi:MAG: DUF1109 domain-containing protein [Alphaproteobacteria bacterium]|nr:DUF1109 domain-containing protein [Alphaproteobacteria bacterium]